MHVSRADLNLFVVFDAIYSQGGVTKAAETLNLTQPTISHALARLRQQLDDPLFVRHGQKLVPTDMARKMIVPVREALSIFERALGDAETFVPSEANMSFSVGLRSLMEHAFFMPLAMALREQSPQSTINSVHYERGNLEADLASGKMNAVIDVFRPVSDAICKKLISRSPSMLVARPGHPKVHDAMTMEEYLELDHIIVTSRAAGLGPEDIMLSRLGKKRNVVMRCQQINTAMRIVNTSDIVLTMVETFAQRANLSFNNMMVSTPFEANQIETYLYWHANSHEDQANRWFRDLVEKAIASQEPYLKSVM